MQPRAANQGTLNFTIGNAGDDNGEDVWTDKDAEQWGNALIGQSAKRIVAMWWF